jgi:hypothetical protein
MLGANRDQWIAILEAAASSSPDEMDDQWEWLLDELGIRYDHFEALIETLRQGTWRDAKNPKAYVKTVTSREAIRLGLVEAPRQEDVLVTRRNSSDPRPLHKGTFWMNTSLRASNPEGRGRNMERAQRALVAVLARAEGAPAAGVLPRRPHVYQRRIWNRRKQLIFQCLARFYARKQLWRPRRDSNPCYRRERAVS